MEMVLTALGKPDSPDLCHMPEGMCGQHACGCPAHARLIGIYTACDAPQYKIVRPRDVGNQALLVQ